MEEREEDICCKVRQYIWDEERCENITITEE
jgi:hypothetical protein